MSTEKTVSRTFNEYEDFQVGEVVRLKSGGPSMTVDNASSERIICVWFDEAKTYHMRNFDQGALEKVISGTESTNRIPETAEPSKFGP